MANDSKHLKGCQRKQLKRALILFLETLEVYLRAGFEISFAWPECHAALTPEVECPFFSELALKTNAQESFAESLQRLSLKYPNPSARPWFGILAELYGAGAPLADAVLALADTLRREEARELEATLRALPARVNVILLLFFLPPALLLIFAPLLMEVLTGF